MPHIYLTPAKPVINQSTFCSITLLARALIDADDCKKKKNIVLNAN